MINQAELKRRFHYNPETGVFTRLVYRSANAQVGDIAGNISPIGYHRINIEGKEMRSHRLAFLYMEGYLPENEVDHRNGDRADNRWRNLREVSIACNRQNSAKINRPSSSIFKGVTTSVSKQGTRWRARLRGKTLGYFITELEAAMVRIAEEIRDPNWHCDAQSHNIKTLIQSEVA